MAQFCHPEFGCDCSEDELTQEEWRAILGAVQQMEDEFGFYVGKPRNATPLEYRESADRGAELIRKLRDKAGYR